MNTEPRTSTANGSAMISATLPMALSTSTPRARHSAGLAGAALRSFWRHFRRHSFCTSRLSRSSRTATLSIRQNLRAARELRFSDIQARLLEDLLGGAMPDTIRRADYYYVTAPDKPGEGAKVFGKLRDAGVNLLAVHAFPSARKSQ